MPTTVPIEKLNRKHPVYGLYQDAWTDFDLLNAGGVRLKNQAQRFLVKRPKELFDVYQERIKRFTYQHIMGQIVGWYIGALWRRNPSIDITEGADPWYSDAFLPNCDRASRQYNDFFKLVFRNLVLYKYCFVLVDRPHADQPPEDRAQEQEMGLDQPYLVPYEPRDVINWQADAFGILKWVVIRTETEETPFLGDSRSIVRWYYFDRTDYQVYEYVQKDASATAVSLYDSSGNKLDLASSFANLIDQGKHALAKVNRVPMRLIEVDDEYWLANRVYLQLLDHVNQDNSLGWALFMANLAMPAIFSDGELGPQTMSESAFLKFGEKDRFEWTEPAGHSFDASSKRLDRLREEIYRTAYLQAQGRSSSASASGASGYSKELDMMPANDALNAYGDILIPAMQAVFSDVVSARGDDETKLKMDVSGFHFETKPATESVSEYQEFLAAGVFEASETLERVMLQRIAADAVEDQNEDTKQTIKDEIDKAPMSAEREQMEQQQQVQQFQQTFAKLSDRAMAKGEGAAIAA
jgi:hypothetical protein